MRKYIRIYRLFLAQYIKTTMQSKVDFLMGFLAFFATQIMGIIFLFVVFNQIPSLDGWSFYEVLFIYGFAQIPRGIDHIFTDYIWILGQNMVLEGSFDRYLLRPIHPLFHICADRFQPDGLGELIIGLVIVAIAAANLSLVITPLIVLLFIASVLLGAVIYTSIKLFFASLAFWIKDSIPLMTVVYNFAEFAKYPVGIYNAPLRFILSYIIPFAFVAFYPAAGFLGRRPLAHTVGLEAVVMVVAWVIAYGTFKRGMSIYESAGS
jgi:ABC-2 type transport system permease protein